MKVFRRIVVVVLVVVVFVVGFGGATLAFDITQPSVSGSNTQVRFVVVTGDTTNSVAARLAKDGLIRNAILFRLWARYRHLDTGIEPGVYFLTPSMTMDQIIHRLQNGIPDQIVVTVPDPLRLTQYPGYISGHGLNNFDAAAFLKTAKTAVLPDGTQLWKKYWFVEAPQPNVAYALEGYLYPNTYDFDVSATTTTVIEKMLFTLMEQICPSPTGAPDQYIYSQAQCKAHAISVNGVNLFTAAEKAYFTTNDTQALYDTLIVASLTSREILSYKDAVGVATVYHNRYLDWVARQNGTTALGDTAGFMGSDPSAEYARDTDNPPTNGKWWAPLADAGNKIDLSNPYNTEAPPPNGGAGNPGLPPGPIAAPVLPEITAAAAPESESTFPNFYLFSDNCGVVHYYKDFNSFSAATSPNATPNLNNLTCPK